MVQAALAQPLGVNVPVAGFAYALGLIRQRPHLLLEKFRLNHDYTMHIFRLNQLVAEIESRCDVPGRLATRAASGISMLTSCAKRKAEAPARSLVRIEDVGAATAFVAHDVARLIHVDGGYHVVG